MPKIGERFPENLWCELGKPRVPRHALSDKAIPWVCVEHAEDPRSVRIVICPLESQLVERSKVPDKLLFDTAGF